MANHVGQILAFDELHGVVMDATLAADRVHRHDVGVMQLRRRLRFVFETLQLLGVERRCERQHLECHAPAQRHLHRLVHHAHAAAADLAQDAKIAERLGRQPFLCRGAARRL